jgi:DNA-binding CsgD family transcriptional regulator
MGEIGYRTLAIDIETFSDVDLIKCGVYAYADSPAFEILLFAYSFDDEETKIIDLAQGEQLTEEIERAMATNNLNSIRQLTVQSLLSREDENTFRRSFATIHPSYLPKLRESYPQLTRNEELLAMLICMNQSTDEIALIMGINRNSVNVVRSRMRKNMELPKEKSLDEVLKQYLT